MPQLITPQQAAQLLGVSHRTLATWRCTGRYDLPFVKVGAKVRYRLEDVEAFIERRTRGGGGWRDAGTQRCPPPA